MFALADKDKDGKLSVVEWEQMLVQAGAPADKKEVEKFFAERDRDFDGRLSLEEFLGEETQIEKLFRLMDKNKDGFVTKKVRNCESFRKIKSSETFQCIKH